MKGSLYYTQRAQFFKDTAGSSLRSKTEHNSQTSLASHRCREQHAGLETTTCKLTGCSRKQRETKDACPEIHGGCSHPWATHSVKGRSLSWQSSVDLCMFIQGFCLRGASMRAPACSWQLSYCCKVWFNSKTWLQHANVAAGGLSQRFVEISC